MTLGSHMLTADRDVDCENAIRDAFDDLVKQAVESGWTEAEVANALLGLAQMRHLFLADDAVIGDIPGGKTRIH